MRRDDATVPRVRSMKRSDGWRVILPHQRAGAGVEHHPVDADGISCTIHEGPTGCRYVQADDDEPATLIREFDDGLSDFRLTDLATSAAVRRAAIRAAQVETGEAITKTRQKKNKAIRQARVKRHTQED